MNTKNKKLMIVDRKRPTVGTSIHVDNIAIKRVTEFIYIGGVYIRCISDNRCLSETEKRPVVES